MNKQTIILLVSFFVVLIMGMFAFAYLKKSEMQSEIAESTEEPAAEQKYASITRIDGKHYYIDGVHTVVGEILMPTPCDLLEVSAQVAESMPEQITLDFDVINNADFCAQVVTAQRFKVSAAASENANFRAVFVGRDVELNLIPAALGETPDEFEVFIKG